ncbi:histone-fold-containing protein [Dacryopinax primogenitus]|uniref:Histone-fold-containing protein n=1 Tax=Dacryopinax primogenitus (strain DJM 731) TaxID=1858805 RepID=M5FSQ4_DACPD|nr:histone-fold-containing protein [Dacryopinax primogenitus]EJT98259.1 histone-fold-containing protein [Dacryopinax primogenitus]
MAVKSKSRQTRFPVARIKKIMQKDDEVGKVAQATPVLISKALEIFMQKLVDEAAHEAKSKGSRKVAAYHLKRTIESIDMFDFLKDLVETNQKRKRWAMMESRRRGGDAGRGRRRRRKRVRRRKRRRKSTSTSTSRRRWMRSMIEPAAESALCGESPLSPLAFGMRETTGVRTTAASACQGDDYV